jgi:23S rRNA (uracil1939-C5)-methyltransferase
MAATSALASTTLLTIDSLDQEGRGVARVDGKAIFVEGALPGERVHAASVRVKPTFETARVTSVVKANASRVVPRCPHFGVCGGCTLQHAHPALQVAAKQRALEEALARIGRVRAERMFPPIEGPAWGYRYRARLTVRHVAKKGVVLVGFHERKSSFVADMTECHVLPRKISDLLPALRLLVASLTIYDRLPQIELAIGETQHGDDVALGYVLVLRILAPLTPDDETKLREFADRHGLRSGRRPAVRRRSLPFHPAHRRLRTCCRNSAWSCRSRRPISRRSTSAINRVLVRRAMALLDPAAGRAVADFFCGLGNFTLPIARRARDVVGVEGSAALVQRAQQNARTTVSTRGRASCRQPVRGHTEEHRRPGPARPRLIDPPREGAIELVKSLPEARRPGGLSASCTSLQSGHARARRRGAGARTRISSCRGRRGQHVPAHGARRIHRTV